MHAERFKNITNVILVSLSLLFLWSCTGAFVQIGYNNADTFVLRRVDAYFNLTKEQRAVLKEKLKKHHEWHRRQELPKYIAILATARGYAADGFSEPEVEQLWQQGEERRDALMREIIADAAEFLSTLKEEQINYFEEKALAEFTEIEKEEQENPQKKQQKREARFLKNYEDWYGSTSRNQKENLAFLARQVPSFSDGLASYRRERLAEFVRHLRSHRGDISANQKILTRYLVNPVAGYPENRRRQVQAFFAGLKKYIVQADRLATDKQRRHLLQTLFKWEERLRALLL